MKTLLILAVFLSISVRADVIATSVTFTNLQGRVYNGVTLDHTNSLGIIWTAQDGSMGQIKYTDLSLETWQQLNIPKAIKNSIVSVANEKLAEKAAADAKRKELEQQEKAAQEQQDRQRAELEKLAKAAQDEKDRMQAEILSDVRSTTNSEEQKIDAMQAKPVLMSAEEKTARDNILKSLLDISSAVAVGVTRNDYGALLAKSVSTLAFEKTKLSTDRHTKYLFCAEKAIGYYAKANDEWSDYFKYDWEREKEQTLMSLSDFKDLAKNGMTIDPSAYQTSDSDKTEFYVPFKESLTMYWNAADIYVQKMHKDVQL